MINAETISKMKDGVKIINLARAELVDSQAMIDAINSGKVSAYVTDFITDDLLGVSDKIVCIPHLGASTEESEDKCAIMAAKELIEYLEKGNIKNSVNFPNVELPHNGDVRICIMHRNVAGVLSKISIPLAAENVNIENMVSRSRGNYAYTIVEIIGQISEAALSELSKIEETIRIRVIS
jgi:D-3-phosphoglycerate dehydrogenase